MNSERAEIEHKANEYDKLKSAIKARAKAKETVERLKHELAVAESQLEDAEINLCMLMQ